MTSTDPAPAPRRYAPRLPPEERREQVLDAVLEVTATDGPGAVTVDGIARRLGVTRPVLYAHFTDANHLLRALLKREEQRALAQLAEVLPLVQSGAPGDIAEGFRIYLEGVLAEPARWRTILLPIGAPPELQKTVRRGRQQQVDQLAEVAADFLPEGMDAELAARMLLTVGEEAGRLVLAEPEAYTVERIVTFAESLAKITVAALQVPDARD